MKLTNSNYPLGFIYYLKKRVLKRGGFEEFKYGSKDKWVNFRRRRIVFSHLHPGSEKEKNNPENPVNPV
jgi:hypothetical protein